MATVSSLIMEANSTVDETFDNADWLSWFNGALGDLTPYLNLEGRSAVEIAYDVYDPSITHREFDLPANCIKINAVLNQSGHTLKFIDITRADFEEGIYIYDNKLCFTKGFEVGAKFNLLYTRRPVQLKNDNDIPEIPEEFQQLIVIYGCYKSQLKDDELDRAQVFYMEYLTQKNSFMDYMKRTRPSKNYGASKSWQVIR